MEHNNMEQKKHGGPRKGSGRPKKERATKVVGIRHDKKVIDKVRQKLNPRQLQTAGREWLDKIAE